MEDVGLGEILEVEESFVNAVIKGRVDEWGPARLRWMFLADVTVSLTRILDPTVERVANNLWKGLDPLETPLVNWWITVPTAPDGKQKQNDAAAEEQMTRTAKALLRNRDIARRALERFDQYAQQPKEEQDKAVTALSDLLKSMENPQGKIVERKNSVLKNGFRFDKPLWTLDFAFDKDVQSRVGEEDECLVAMIVACFRLCFHRQFHPNLSPPQVDEVRALATDEQFKLEVAEEVQRHCSGVAEGALEGWWKAFQSVPSIAFQELKIIRPWTLKPFSGALMGMSRANSQLQERIAIVEKATGLKFDGGEVDKEVITVIFEHLHGEGDPIGAWQDLTGKLKKSLGKIHMQNTLGVDDHCMEMNKPIQALKIMYKYPLHEPSRVASWSDLDITALTFFLCDLELVSDKAVRETVRRIADFRNRLLHDAKAELDDAQFQKLVDQVRDLVEKTKAALSSHNANVPDVMKSTLQRTQEVESKVGRLQSEGWQMVLKEEFRKEDCEGIVTKLVRDYASSQENVRGAIVLLKGARECFTRLEEKVEHIKDTTDETSRDVKVLLERSGPRKGTHNLEELDNLRLRLAEIVAASGNLEGVRELEGHISFGKCIWIVSRAWGGVTPSLAWLATHKDEFSSLKCVKFCFHSFSLGSEQLDPSYRSERACLNSLTAQLQLGEDVECWSDLMGSLADDAQYVFGFADIEKSTTENGGTSVLEWRKNLGEIPSNVCVLVTSLVGTKVGSLERDKLSLVPAGRISPVPEEMDACRIFYRYFCDTYRQWEEHVFAQKENVDPDYAIIGNVFLLTLLYNSTDFVRIDELKWILHTHPKFDFLKLGFKALISPVAILEGGCASLQYPLRQVVQSVGNRPIAAVFEDIKQDLESWKELEWGSWPEVLGQMCTKPLLAQAISLVRDVVNRVSNGDIPHDTVRSFLSNCIKIPPSWLENEDDEDAKDAQTMWEDLVQDVILKVPSHAKIDEQLQDMMVRTSGNLQQRAHSLYRERKQQGLMVVHSEHAEEHFLEKMAKALCQCLPITDHIDSFRFGSLYLKFRHSPNHTKEDFLLHFVKEFQCKPRLCEVDEVPFAASEWVTIDKDIKRRGPALAYLAHIMLKTGHVDMLTHLQDADFECDDLISNNLLRSPNAGKELLRKCKVGAALRLAITDIPEDCSAQYLKVMHDWGARLDPRQLELVASSSSVYLLALEDDIRVPKIAQALEQVGLNPEIGNDMKASRMALVIVLESEGFPNEEIRLRTMRSVDQWKIPFFSILCNDVSSLERSVSDGDQACRCVIPSNSPVSGLLDLSALEGAIWPPIIAKAAEASHQQWLQSTNCPRCLRLPSGAKWRQFHSFSDTLPSELAQVGKTAVWTWSMGMKDATLQYLTRLAPSETDSDPGEKLNELAFFARCVLGDVSIEEKFLCRTSTNSPEQEILQHCRLFVQNESSGSHKLELTDGMPDTTWLCAGGALKFSTCVTEVTPRSARCLLEWGADPKLLNPALAQYSRTVFVLDNSNRLLRAFQNAFQTFGVEVRPLRIHMLRLLPSNTVLLIHLTDHLARQYGKELVHDLIEIQERKLIYVCVVNSSARAHWFYRQLKKATERVESNPSKNVESDPSTVSNNEFRSMGLSEILDRVPGDLWDEIFARLDLRDLGRICLVSKELNRICSGCIVTWKAMYERLHDHHVSGEDHDVDWKDRCKKIVTLPYVELGDFCLFPEDNDDIKFKAWFRPQNNFVPEDAWYTWASIMSDGHWGAPTLADALGIICTLFRLPFCIHATTNKASRSVADELVDRPDASSCDCRLCLHFLNVVTKAELPNCDLARADCDQILQSMENEDDIDAKFYCYARCEEELLRTKSYRRILQINYEFAGQLITFERFDEAHRALCRAEKLLQKCADCALFSDIVWRHMAMIHHTGISESAFLQQIIRIFLHENSRLEQLHNKVWEALVKVSTQFHHVDRAFEVYQSMLDAKQTPNEVTFSSLIHACATSRQVDRAFEVYQSMLDAKQTPNEVTFNRT